MNRNTLVKGFIATLVVCTTLSMVSCGGLHLHSSKINGTPSNKVWFEEDSYSTNSIPMLVKKSEADYKILLLADIQIDWWHKKVKKEAFRQISQLIDTTNPDFIVCLGDNTQGHLSDIMAKKLIKHMEEFNIPWTVVLGNHDSEGRKGRPWYGNHYEDAENSLFEYGPSNIHGVGNFPVHLKDEKDNIIYSFLMMDSNDYREYEDGGGYDFIHQDQIAWYKWQVKEASGAQYGEYDPDAGKVVPSICFFHIPLLEYADASKAAKDGTIDSRDVVGDNKEGIASAKLNSGLFSAMKELESTTHVFVGHDHVNNLSVDWQGIKLSYGLKTGPGSYYDPEKQGGTLLTIEHAEENDKPKVEIEYIYLTKHNGSLNNDIKF